MTEQRHGPLGNIVHGLTGWHVILLVVMIGGLFLQNARFTTHVEDFENQILKDVAELSEDVEMLEAESDEARIDLTKMAADIHRIDERLDSVEASLKLIDEKIDEILERM